MQKKTQIFLVVFVKRSSVSFWKYILEVDKTISFRMESLLINKSLYLEWKQNKTTKNSFLLHAVNEENIIYFRKMPENVQRKKFLL